MEFNLENPLTNFLEGLNDDIETMPALFLVESDHMPSENYLKTLRASSFDVSLREGAISSILQFSGSYDPFLSYLASNYLDRFFSSQIMLQRKPWILRLVAVSCISLAAKMRKTEFTFANFQGDGGLIFDSQTIERMEYLILGALKWRMRSITPFSFLSYFISLFKLKDPPLRQCLKARASQIIFKAQNHIEFLEFKPSIIAASALLSASHELFPLQFSCFRKAISNCSYVNKESMLQCYNAVQDMATDGHESGIDTVSSSDTPVNVLDWRFSSSDESDKSLSVSGTTTITTTNNPLSPDRDIKRRKMSGYCNSHRSQLSQMRQC